MNRSQFATSAAGLALASCSNPSALLSRTARSGVYLPAGTGSPQSHDDFKLGDYYFSGPAWLYERGRGYGYLISKGPLGHTHEVGYICAWPWEPPGYSSGPPGVSIEFGMGCELVNMPPSVDKCAHRWDLTFANHPPDQIDKWLKHHVVKIFDTYYSIGDSVPDGCIGGTTRDSKGRALYTVYKDHDEAVVIQYQGERKQFRGRWPGKGKGLGEPDINGRCAHGILNFVVGLGGGIAGCLTSEAGVGLIGVITGGITMIGGAVDIRNGCFSK